MATKKKIKQINLIPLINIIFLMLIFFMLAGTITTIKNRKKELQKRNYLEILRSRKPNEVSLKIDSQTPSEYFLKILKILENENIKKVVVETNYVQQK